MGAGITPREHLDEIAESLIPAKGLVQKPPLVSIEMLPLDFDGVLLSFDGAAKTSTRQGSCGCILWKLPEWTILEARGFILENVTVNDAEYHGLLKGLSMASARKIDDLIAVGDSRIVIQQVQGLINCNQSHLQKHLAVVETLKAAFKSLRLVHLKRDFNQAADYLTSKTLLLGESWEVQDEIELAHLRQVSKIAAKLMTHDAQELQHSDSPSPNAGVGSSDPKDGMPSDAASAPLPHAAKVMAVLTRSTARDVPDPEVSPMGPLEFQAERWRRIKAHQEEDEFLSEIITFLKGDFGRFSPRRLRKVAKIADLFVLDTRDILYRLARSTRDRPRDFVSEPRLVVPKDLREDMIQYAHEDYQGGHQGITRTFEKLRLEFYWPGMYRDVKSWVEECVDCASGKGRPPNAGPSPGNIEPRRPFELVSMDFVTHMPKSARGNTFFTAIPRFLYGFCDVQADEFDHCSRSRRSV
jgi:ribonuclease HI